MKKQKENSHEGITWSEMGKQNVQAEKVYFFSNQHFVAVFGLLVDCTYNYVDVAFIFHIYCISRERFSLRQWSEDFFGLCL